MFKTTVAVMIIATRNFKLYYVVSPPFFFLNATRCMEVRALVNIKYAMR